MTTVKDTRAGLRRYRATDEIIVAWWDKEWFETMLDTTLTDDELQQIRGVAETVLEYCDLGDQLQIAAENALYDMNGDAA